MNVRVNLTYYYVNFTKKYVSTNCVQIVSKCYIFLY